MNKINAAEYPLKEIFSQKFDYCIPSYQRPYAWGESQSNDLFEDLYDFYCNRENKEDTYFLGSIVLIKSDAIPHAEVIDGQQRLTTLTILFAIIATQFNKKEYKTSFEKYVRQAGDPAERLEPKPRLALRDKDKDFFAKSIQSFEFASLYSKDSASFENEAQINIQKNSKLLEEKIRETFLDDNSLLEFGMFLVNECFIVVVSTPSQQSAFRVFSVLNNRGLDLLPTDIIKADIIGSISDVAKRDDYNQSWEDLEILTGRDGFTDLFLHIRMIFNPEKAKYSILKEFKDVVVSKAESAEDLIDNILNPYAKAYSCLKNANYKAKENSEKINDFITWLNKIDNSDWLPAAMLAIKFLKNDPDKLLQFFKSYEQVVAFLHLTAKTRGKRIEKYSTIINKLKSINKSNGVFNDSFFKKIQLNTREQQEMIDILDGNIYQSLTARRRNYLILRLDSFISDSLASYKTNTLTIEHVLPQTLKKDCWDTFIWTEEKHNEWVHRLANLVPLSQRRNSQASNYGFEKKKLDYFGGKKNVTHYILTNQVMGEVEWTPEVLNKRQQCLLSILKENWMLV